MGDQDLPGVLVSGFKGPHGICEDHVRDLQKHFHLITMEEFLENKTQLAPKIRAVFVWGGRPAVDRELLRSLPSLRIVASAGAGLDHLDLALIASSGVKVASTPHAVSSPTADLGMALLLAAARRVVEGHQLAVSPDTEKFSINWMGQGVTGATLGIIGMGSIGYKIAQRARAFEMKILYHNRKRRKLEEEGAVGATYCARLDDLLQWSDFVMLAVSLTPQTQGLVGRRELSLMKPSATLINIGRGPLVDQDALVEALQTGVIKAAALDVTSPEPLPRKKFWYEGPSLGSHLTYKPSQLESLVKSTSKRARKEDHVRLRALNGLLHKALTGLLCTPEVSQEVCDLNVELSKVSLTADFSACRVSWKASLSAAQNAHTEAVLQRSAAHMRHLVMSQQILRNMPPIVFVQDKKYAAVAEVDRLLAVADFGPRDEKEELVQDDFRDPKALDAASPCDTPGPAVPSSLCGIDHEALNQQILEYKRGRGRGGTSPARPEHVAVLMKQVRKRRAHPPVDDDLSPKSFLLGLEGEEPLDGRRALPEEHGLGCEWGLPGAEQELEAKGKDRGDC
uniref:Glyoxylate reductase/hydroxypyruvate reductase n=1 Tax=Camelus bactrianus TaxID=9837 RepID=A0A9W3HN40_CAMBA|nr:putative ribosome-binding factor A, mitochondrial isoform X1 [Camelus bactrianus]XP_045377928.1 putative ribosome-binding factor A, mitochondrial isoform X1 [Camelus bactrianus]XP_045377930.1 putative ribosome-binding factor A, mitochondrial isoform X1 [Camelus bactrianus]XP_045377934.1 putative ribosome-binding factor A, mitochondrial isoform X1 [Camelus bactrianus]XP_045377939.1 putative ribosome-binding factor A, mitochondrial isoform X1 [Camelus bactrianus]XP_045377942.1 putative riboso